MILEIAVLDVRPGHESAFEAAFAKAGEIFAQARGCGGATLVRAIETPLRYVLQVQWSHLDDHLVAFREDGLLDRWRALVADHLAGPPSMLHYREVR